MAAATGDRSSSRDRDEPRLPAGRLVVFSALIQSELLKFEAFTKQREHFDGELGRAGARYWDAVGGHAAAPGGWPGDRTGS
jgi:hypothetical protein